MSFFALPLAQTWLVRDEPGALSSEIMQPLYDISVTSRQGRPPIAQSNGRLDVSSPKRFKTAHMDFHFSARAKREVRQFETALYGTLF